MDRTNRDEGGRGFDRHIRFKGRPEGVTERAKGDSLVCKVIRLEVPEVGNKIQLVNATDERVPEPVLGPKGLDFCSPLKSLAPLE